MGFIALLFSCDDNPLDIDVSQVQVDLKVQRFDQDLFTTGTAISPESAKQLQENYGTFFQDFTMNIINIGDIRSPEAQYHLNAFVNDQYILEIKSKSDALYRDFTPYTNQLTDAFKHYKHYFPKRKTPKIITYISGYNYAIVTDEQYLGIGLDMFLGAKHDAYAKLGLPKYKSDFMTPDYLVSGAMLGWVSTEFELDNNQADLLTEMIHQGKILYLLDALMPEASNSVKINYTQEQLDWCEANAEAMWFYFIDNELLYTKTMADIAKYMGEAPFIQGFPDGSPGRVGHWIGWQIVKAYMKQQPNTTLEQLMQNNNAQEILTKSKYKP
ncbi:MAG: gliding motility lipoprotein GldB [Flavobacteriales bacterium]|nr:gliding motility lipoprotein GldB [Flavobacteriales bacterium]